MELVSSGSEIASGSLANKMILITAIELEDLRRTVKKQRKVIKKQEKMLKDLYSINSSPRIPREKKNKLSLQVYESNKHRRENDDESKKAKSSKSDQHKHSHRSKRRASEDNASIGKEEIITPPEESSTRSSLASDSTIQVSPSKKEVRSVDQIVHQQKSECKTLQKDVTNVDKEEEHSKATHRYRVAAVASPSPASIRRRPRFIAPVRSRSRGGNNNFGNIDVDRMTYEELLSLEQRLGEVKKRGATQLEIKSLPTMKLKEQSSVPQGTCTICLNDFAKGDTLKRLPCFHPFHSDCVDNWLVVKKECPICKAATHS